MAGYQLLSHIYHVSSSAWPVPKGLRGSPRGPVSSLAHRAGGILWSWLILNGPGDTTMKELPSLWYPFNTSPGWRQLHVIAVLSTPPEAAVSLYLKDVDSVIWFPYESRCIISSLLSSSSPFCSSFSITFSAPHHSSHLPGTCVVLSAAWEPLLSGPLWNHHSRWPKGNMWENRASLFQDHQHRKQADTKKQKTNKKKNPDLPFVTPMQYA